MLLVILDCATAAATAATTAVATKVNPGKIFIQSVAAHCRAAAVTGVTGVATTATGVATTATGVAIRFRVQEQQQ